VILIGVDHNFETKGQPNLVTHRRGRRPNHFTRVTRQGLPLAASRPGRLRTCLLAGKSRLRGCQPPGPGCTVGGKLSIFPKVNYPSLFSRKIKHPWQPLSNLSFPSSPHPIISPLSRANPSFRFWQQKLPLRKKHHRGWCLQMMGVLKSFNKIVNGWHGGVSEKDTAGGGNS